MWHKLVAWPAGVSVAYAAVVALLFYRNNVYDVPPGQLILPITLFTSVVYASYFIFRRIFSNVGVAELVTLLFTVFTVHFDRLFRLFRSFQQQISNPIKDVLLGSIFLAAGLACCIVIGFAIRSKESLCEPVLKFARASVFSFFALTVTTVFYFYSANWRLFSFENPVNIQAKGQAVKKENLPDIYYLVFDRYAGRDVLKERYDFDNQYFINEMKEEGFVINEIEYSNYGHTGPSVSSTLNMQYLDEPTAGLPPKYSEMMYSRMIDQASSLRILKENEYEIGWSGSWWEPTRSNVSADISYNQIFKVNFLGTEFNISEWQELLLSKHVLGRIIAADLPVVRNIMHYRIPNRREIVQYQLDSLKHYVDKKTEKSKFAFWHFLVPHTPYVFDENGDIPKYNANPEAQDVPEKEKYTQQLTYVNKQIAETVRYILNNSSRPPVIVFQPDEGPFLYKDETGKQVKVTKAERLKWKHGVTSMFYLPGYNQKTIEVSPVNIFRYLFNEYLGYDFEYLPDLQYDYSRKNPYNFEDVTILIKED